MKPKVVAIVQARMGSSRLPGKVGLPLRGRTMLGYLVDRVSLSRTIDQVVVATTAEPCDDSIVRDCRRLGIAYYRGSTDDVLGRYYATAMLCRAAVIVRVTADNPFTDPQSIDYVVSHLLRSDDEYAIEMNLPVGTTGEAITWPALARLHVEALQPRWREHVTLYAKENPQRVRCAFLPGRADCHRPDLSFTVDHRSEYEWVDNLSEILPNCHFDLKKLIQIADETREVSSTAAPEAAV